MKKNSILKKIFYFISALSCLFLFLFPTKYKISTNILNILSDNSRNEDFFSVSRAYENKIRRKVIFLFESEDKDYLLQKIPDIQKKMKSFRALKKKIFLTNDSVISTAPSFFLPYHQNLLHLEEINLIEGGSKDSFFGNALKKIYSPFGFEASLLNEDPFLLFPDFFLKKSLKAPFGVEGKYFFLKESPKTLVVYGEVDLEKVDELKKDFTSLKSLFPKVKMMADSLSFHEKEAQNRVKKESLLFSFVSIVLIVLIFSLSGLGIKNLLFCIGTISISLSSGLFFVGSFSRETIGLALLFSISGVGIIADYVIHFFSKELGSREEDGKKVLIFLKKPMLGSLLTSILGFSIFYFTPLKMLEQFSLISVISVTVAVIILFLFGPSFFSSGREMSLKNPSLYSFLNLKLYFSIGCFILGAWLINLSTFDHDIRSFDALVTSQKKESTEVRKRLGAPEGMAYFLLRGESVQEVLELEESILGELEMKKIKSNSTSEWIPSLRKQKKSWSSYQSLSMQGERLLSYLKVKKREAILEREFSNKWSPLLFENWKGRFGDSELGHYWMGKFKSSYYSVINIEAEEKSQKVLKELTSKNVVLFDKIKQTNEAISEIFNSLSRGFILFVFILFLLLSYFFSLKGAFYIIVPSLSASCASFGLLSYFISSAYLVTLLGCFLVFTLGVDYALYYFFSSEDSRGQVQRSVNLSVLTTLSSFGVLFLSSTQAVSNFGCIIFLGILLCWFLSPLSIKGKKL